MLSQQTPIVKRRKLRLPERRPSAHQKLIRFFTVFFIVLTALIFTGLMVLISR